MRRKRYFHRLFVPALFCLTVGLPTRALAQTTDGWALNRYEPAPMGDTFFVAEHPWYSSTRVFSVGLYGDYAINPLRLQVNPTPGAGANAGTRDDITGMFVVHVGAQVSFLDRVGVHLSLPVSLVQTGSLDTTGIAVPQRVSAADSPAIGDLRAGARVRIFGHADRSPISLHVGVNFWAPTGSRASNTGDENIRLEPRLTLAGRGGPVRWSFTGAFTLRSDTDVLNLAIGNELKLTAGVGFVFLNDRLMIGPEAYVVTALRDLSAAQGGGSAAFKSGQWGAEVYLGASYLIADAFRIGVAGGPGLEQGPGIPTARVLMNLAYAPVSRPAPEPVDADGDGVTDSDDRCPTTPQGDHPNPAQRGCPMIDTDGDGVFDEDDQCVNEPQGDHPDPARRGCPAPDRDGDGVFDPDDQCPTEAQGDHPDPTRRGCPAGDRDSDTVYDHEDVCPDQNRLPFPDPARNGCPLPDADHDQVPEPPDACPNQPGVPSSDPARNGCPNTRISVDSGQIRIVEQVFFATDRDTILPRSFRILTAVAEVLRAAPHIRRVSVNGHTDNRASDEHNNDLSQRRANSVVRWLTEHGVDAARLEAHGYGASRPIAPNTNEAGRARNRRVEFVILDPAQPQGVVTQPAAAAPPTGNTSRP